MKNDLGETNILIGQYQHSKMLRGFRDKVSNSAEEMNQERKVYQEMVAVVEKK